jgi:phage terminase large subunit GpA-like protein
VPCPHCGEFQHLKFPQLKWSDEDPATAAYACEHCGALIEERHKAQMLPAGEWRATSISTNGTVGFHLNSLYSPLGWKSWAEIVSEFLAAKHDVALLKTFVNTVLGETFDDEQATRLGAEDLKSRVEFYQEGQAPGGVLAITVGVDVQDNRLAVSHYGWGRGEECWMLRHQEIFGDPAQDEIWVQLDSILAAPVPHERAEPLTIAAACIDSGGHYTNEVYAYTRSRKARFRNLLAIKGASTKNKPVISKPTPVDFNWKKQVLKKGTEVALVGTDTAKDTLLKRMRSAEPGAGSIHFHAAAGAEYFEQITAERKATRYVKGFPVREYVKKSGARNEALDCLVYSYAALHYLFTKYNRATFWEQMERSLKIPEKTEAPKPQTTQNKARQAPARRGNFMTSW